jgi:hypothetical protein
VSESWDGVESESEVVEKGRESCKGLPSFDELNSMGRKFSFEACSVADGEAFGQGVSAVDVGPHAFVTQLVFVGGEFAGTLIQGMFVALGVCSTIECGVGGEAFGEPWEQRPITVTGSRLERVASTEGGWQHPFFKDRVERGAPVEKNDGLVFVGFDPRFEFGEFLVCRGGEEYAMELWEFCKFEHARIYSVGEGRRI